MKKQEPTKQEIEDFYDHVKQRGFRFPVAAIERATKLSKGYISEVLRRIKEPSQELLNAYWAKFRKSSVSSQMELPGDMSTYWARFDQLLSMAERNSNIIDKLSEALLERKISSGGSQPYGGLQDEADKEAQKAARGVNGGKSKTHLTGKKGKQKGNGSGADK